MSKLILDKEATECAGNFDDGYDYMKSAEACAAEKGCYVVYPKGNELQLDIDTKEQYDIFLQRLVNIEDVFREQLFYIAKPSKSGLPKQHITIRWPEDLDEWQRLSLQFLLGSDPIRESLNVLRKLRGVESPSRLFEKLANQPEDKTVEDLLDNIPF